MPSILSLTQLILLAGSVVGLPNPNSFPEYRSLAGLSPEEVREVARTFTSTPGAQLPPPPINDTSSKLVNDEGHPWMPLGPDDIRGPCPGLNTLASHGYLPRSGVATPGEIITAAQEGFNMGWDIAAFITYAAFLVDGNQLTNLMSIGQKTPETGKDAPAPAIIGGLNTHGTFEGDASTTRGDFYFGDNHSFNETLFEQLATAAQDVGNGTINLVSASLHRKNRILDSIARNPNFTFLVPRFLTAFGETAFPLGMFVNHQDENSTLPLSVEDARSFFQESKFPDGFFRREGAFDTNRVGDLTGQVIELAGGPFAPGQNDGVGNFVVNQTEVVALEGDGLCFAYYKQSNLTVMLYPNPEGALRTALQQNLANFYNVLGDTTCTQIFPFGQ